MDFGEVLTTTWQITWRYKGLWVLGLLAGCGTGGGGGGSGWRSSGSVPQMEQAVMQIPEWVWIAVAVFALIMVVAFLVLGVIGTGGLIAAFRRADEGQDVSLGEAFRLGGKYFWRLLGFRLLLLLAGLIMAALIFLASVVSLGTCLIVFLCLALPAFFALAVYISICQVSLIDDEQATLAAFRRGWEVVRLHPGPAALMGLILLGGGLVIGMMISLPIILVMLPMFVALASQEQTVVTAGMVVSGLCFLGFLPILLLVSAVLQTYVNGAWTLTYRRLTGKGPRAAAATGIAIPEPG